MAINSQSFVPIKEIRDGVVIMKDNSIRSVLMTSSVNFALKSNDEQEGIIFQFQNFLNTLNFSIQIFTQSRKLDIRPYIGLLEGVLKEQRNDLLRIQTREYIEFIKNFTESVNIMSKSFFIVVPYVPALIQGKGNMIKNMMGKNNAEDNLASKTDNFEENKTQLEQRVEVVMQGLNRMGIRAVPLGTDELVELYYKLFNPGETEKPINLDQVARR